MNVSKTIRTYGRGIASPVPALLLTLLLTVLPAGAAAAQEAPRWWKGNLHTHSLWSDGDAYPEVVVDWYARHGYDFIALSDHNTLAEGERWVDVPAEGDRRDAFGRYVVDFGLDWVETRSTGDTLQARLKTLAEYRPLFEEPGRFLILQSEEISDRFERKPIHVNATNIHEHIAPQGGGSVREVMQNNIDAVLAQRERTGQPMFPHINHPNFGWAVTAEDLMDLEGERFFEVYNGHPAVHNEGDALRPGTERIWDIVLTHRLAHGREVMYGLATDDAHNYGTYDSTRSNPGRAWVMVRSAELTPEAIVAAMEAGDFYGTTGVILDDVRIEEDRLALRIRPEAGVTYVTQFIGTRAGYDASSEPVTDAEGAAVTRRYSEDVGEVLAEVEGPTPTYTFAGDELYVRARVVSSRPKANPYRSGETEKAWTQPVIP